MYICISLGSPIVCATIVWIGLFRTQQGSLKKWIYTYIYIYVCTYSCIYIRIYIHVNVNQYFYVHLYFEQGFFWTGIFRVHTGHLLAVCRNILWLPSLVSPIVCIHTNDMHTYKKMNQFFSRTFMARLRAEYGFYKFLWFHFLWAPAIPACDRLRRDVDMSASSSWACGGSWAITTMLPPPTL